MHQAQRAQLTAPDRLPPLALSEDGRLIATAQGSELFAYSGINEAGVAAYVLGESICAVRFEGEEVRVLGEEGLLVAYDDTLVERWRLALGRKAQDLVLLGDGQWAAAMKDGVQLGRSEVSEAFIELPGVTCLAAQGQRIAVGTRAGVIHVFEDGECTRTIELGAAISGLCGNEEGWWFATTGTLLVRIPKEGRPYAIVNEDDAVSCPVVMGPIIACRLGERMAALYCWTQPAALGGAVFNHPIGEVSLFDGRREVLAVASKDGHAVLFNLTSEHLRFTDPLPGRPTCEWTFAPRLKYEQLAEILAHPPAVARHDGGAAHAAVPAASARARVLLALILATGLIVASSCAALGLAALLSL